MKNILYVCSTLKRSGPTNQLFNIVKNLPSSDYRVIVCTLSYESKDSLKTEFISNNIEVMCLGLTRVAGLFLMKRRFERLVREFKPDIIHSQGVRSDKLVSGTDVDSLKIATLRNYPQLDYPMTYGKILGRYLSLIHSRSLRKMNLVVGVSNGVCDNLSEYFGITNTRTILNGVDTTKFYFKDSKMSLRSQLGLPKDKTIWISVGHLSSRKDPESVIRSFSEYNETKSDAMLIFVGDGPLAETCNKYSSSNVRVIGRVPNVYDYLNASDFFISASKAEGFPNTVLESLACGLPVVLSDIEPHKEFFDLGYNIGSLYRLGNGCSEEMTLVSNQDYSSMHSSSLELIDECLSAEVMSRKYQEIYKGGIR
ncbi:glycosyltransferase [Vibrio ostreae]|uniref:Glycosyltransferase n=1 Tax=Vibrio ostreae TaxID=2841925 RepID=A0A975YN86_9VIBR|nr:glycosyltransferase [Vibrio ostreae]